MRDIPATAIEVQTGLWATFKTISAGSLTVTKCDLYSSEGYCFYVPENNLDENGNLLPANERLYYQYMSAPLATVDEINSFVVSVPVQDGYEIANVGTKPEQETM